MSAIRSPRRHTVRWMGLGGTAALLTAWQTSANGPWTSDAMDLPARVLEMRRNLPTNMANGSLLEDVRLEGKRLTLRLLVDERLSLAAVRDGDRSGKCNAWRRPLRSRDLNSVEYRYVQTGATSSVFIDRTVCN